MPPILAETQPPGPVAPRNGPSPSLSGLGLRGARLRRMGNEAVLEVDARDLWRVVARRDEVLARLAESGIARVSVDLGSAAPDAPDVAVFL